MIFATVGTQLPFPRLMDALNQLAHKSDEKIVAQTGPQAGQWDALECHETLTPAQFEALFTTARVVVAHAGIGTILSAKRYGRPLVILPRQAKFDEHRNDHQLATARQVDKISGVHVAWDVDALEALLSQDSLEAATASPSPSHQALITYLQDFIGP